MLAHVVMQGSEPSPPLPPTARRALTSMDQGDWVKAMQVLEASPQDSGSTLNAADKAAVQALRAICQGHLQLPVSAKEGLASNSPATAFRLPGVRNKGASAPWWGWRG